MQKSWKDSLKVYSKKNSWIMLFLGFSSGLPFMLTYGPLSIWLTEMGIDRAKITAFSWIGLCYSFKIFWAPLVDQMSLPLLTKWFGRRRSWIIVGQVGSILGLVGIALSNPSQGLTTLVCATLFLAFFSATQDIVIDAFRIEAGGLEDQGAFVATYTVGYRLSMMMSGIGCLAIAQFFDPDPNPKSYDYHSWMLAYLAMAGCMFLGVLATLLVKEPPSSRVVAAIKPKRSFGEWFKDAYVMPFKDFVVTYKWPAILILSLISIYRISDVVLGKAAYPFYTEMGFTKMEVAAVSKGIGVVMTILGSVLAGVVIPRFGVMKTLFAGALLSAASNLLFAILAAKGHNIAYLTYVISADNLSGGLASVAFIVYLSGLTNVSYTATQYALFSSLMPVLPNILGGLSGAMINAFTPACADIAVECNNSPIGYSKFFIFTALIGLPVLVLVALAAKYAPTKAQAPLPKSS